MVGGSKIEGGAKLVALAEVKDRLKAVALAKKVSFMMCPFQWG